MSDRAKKRIIKALAILLTGVVYGLAYLVVAYSYLGENGAVTMVDQRFAFMAAVTAVLTVVFYEILTAFLSAVLMDIE